MTEMTNEEQVSNWKTELRSAMDDQQWRQALKFCSWLRYTLDQQGRVDPEVEQIHQRAKEALAEQVMQERAQQERQRMARRLQHLYSKQISSCKWMRALDTVESFHRQSTNYRDTLMLLEQLKARLSRQFSFIDWQENPRASAVKQRFNEVVEHIRSDALAD